MLLDPSLGILHEFGKFFRGLFDKFAQMRRGGRDGVEIEHCFCARENPLIVQKGVWRLCATLPK